jgi:Iron-containing redox enzyme
MKYGDVLAPADLLAGGLPPSRGPLTDWLFAGLRTPPSTRLPAMPQPVDDILYGDDSALALYCLYELHYRGFSDVDDDWEWAPALLAARAELERRLESRIRDEVPTHIRGTIPERLYEICTPQPGSTARSLSTYLSEDGTVDQLREFAVHRSAYQLKEADPHTWALPRLSGQAKAAMVEIQADEYGAGVERDMHQTLFAVTMSELGLDVGYNAYLPQLPGVSLATTNLVSYFGLHRRLRGALVGHLALFEMTSVEPMGRYSAALRRHGAGAAARHFYDVHVVADAHHQTVAAEQLAVGLARQEPHLTADIIFGAEAVTAVESTLSAHLLDSWARGDSSLRAVDADRRSATA